MHAMLRLNMVGGDPCELIDGCDAEAAAAPVWLLRLTSFLMALAFILHRRLKMA